MSNNSLHNDENRRLPYSIPLSVRTLIRLEQPLCGSQPAQYDTTHDPISVEKYDDLGSTGTDPNNAFDISYGNLGD